MYEEWLSRQVEDGENDDDQYFFEHVQSNEDGYIAPYKCPVRNLEWDPDDPEHYLCDPLPIALFFVCKTICNEVLPLLYAENHFQIKAAGH